MFIGTPVCLWHQHPVLLQCNHLNFSVANSGFIFQVAFSRFGRRPAPAWNFCDLQRIRQAFANHIDPVPALDATAGCRTFTVNLYVPAGYGCRCLASRFEEAAVEQPSIDTQGIRSGCHDFSRFSSAGRFSLNGAR
jgi:hypothetical protein